MAKSLYPRQGNRSVRQPEIMWAKIQRTLTNRLPPAKMQRWQSQGFGSENDSFLAVGLDVVGALVGGGLCRQLHL